MMIAALDELDFAPDYPELAGKRVLVTGVAGPLGVDVVRAFAEARARLVVQAVEDSPETQALAEIIAPYAMDVKLFSGALEGTERKLRFARDAAQKFGGLDVVVNLTQTCEPPSSADADGLEALVAECLALPVLTTRVAVNRMRTMLSPGVVINVVTSPRDAKIGGQMVGQIARQTLASFTRNEAEAAAADAIRINAIVPAARTAVAGQVLSGTADIATLALHLASDSAPELSGLVFEAWCG